MSLATRSPRLLRRALPAQLAEPSCAAALEPLEPRQLLATHAIADFLPLTNGGQWSYAGTLNGDPVTAVVRSAAGGTISGFATTRLRTTLTPVGGGAASIDDRYYAHTVTGLRLLRQVVNQPDLTTDTLFGAGVRFATIQVDDGATVHFLKSFTSTTSTGETWSGVLSGNVTIVGLENITVGAGSFEALRLTITGAFSETNTDGLDATGQITETRWLVRGVGAVRVDYSSATTFASEREPEAFRYNLGLTSSNRLNGVTSMLVRGRGVDIAYEDSSPGAADGTNYTGIDVNGGLKTRVFTITNTTSQPITLAPGSQGFITITGTNADDFVVVRQPAQTILPGHTTPFSVRFDPSTTGFRFATVSFTTTAANAAPFQFDIRGAGILLGVIQLFGPTGQFIPAGAGTPNTATGTLFGSTAAAGVHHIQRIFTIANTGPGPLVLTSSPRVVITGANAADFNVTFLPSAMISPGGSALFKISFDPSAIGARTAVVTLFSNDRINPAFSFTIGGVGA